MKNLRAQLSAVARHRTRTRCNVFGGPGPNEGATYSEAGQGTRHWSIHAYNALMARVEELKRTQS
jgi:hypothetical protein